jgi:hypothetical protein
MKQILNIFRKDARHHWIEISLFLLVLAVYVWVEPSRWIPIGFRNRLHSFLMRFMIIAVILAEWLLIVRVIQGESLVGDRQFWITRPYDWKKLLTAKLMFLVIFIQLPLLLMGVVLVAIAGFPSPWSFAPGIVGAQSVGILLALPILALAVVTPNVGQLFLGLLLLVAYIAGMTALAEYIPNVGFPDDVSGVVALVLIIGCGAAFFYQYAKRRTLWTRLILVSVALIIPALLQFAPNRALANYDYPTKPNEQLPVQLALGTKKPTGSGGFEKDKIELDIPIKFSGLQPGTVVSIDGAMLTVEPPGQPSWNSGWHSTYEKLMPDRSEFRLDFGLKRSFFEKVKSQPVRARIVFALRLFRDKQTKRIVVTNGEFSIPEVGLCWIDKKSQTSSVRCRYAVKTPDFVTMLAYAESTCPHAKLKAGEQSPAITSYDFSGARDGTGPLSPVDTLNLYFQRWDIDDITSQSVPGICPGTPFTVAMQEEVKKLQTTLDINSIKLEDYAQTTTFLLAP